MSSSLPAATPGSAPDDAPRSRWALFLRALSPRTIGLTLVFSLVVAVVLNPIFELPFTVLLGRTLFVGFITLVARSAALTWPQRLMPPWVLQSVTVLVAATLATLAVYLLATGGDINAVVSHEGRLQGFILISGTGTIVGLILALGALERQRDSEAKAMGLELALQRSRLERHAADARLAVLTAQVEPHFLFNTLANVQALVETGSPRAPAVLRSLIAYLKATMPRLDDGDTQLGREMSLVRSYLELMHLRMPDRLRFSVESDPALQGFPCPPMLLLTLVENAVRHGIDPSETGGNIVVTASREAHGRGDQVRLSVRDDGVGMGESTVPGTGLVNLRERLAAFYGGAARLELSELVPHGLLAEILVDMAAMTPSGENRMTEPTPLDEHDDDAPRPRGPSTPGAVRALIVDDEPLLRTHLAHHLGQLWPELEIAGEARNGREAVDLVEQLKPDVVFLDVHMPGMNGVEAARLMGPDVQIVFVTAYEQYAVAAFEQGAIDYLVKPFDAERLGESVARLRRRVAERRRMGPSEGASGASLAADAAATGGPLAKLPPGDLDAVLSALAGELRRRAPAGDRLQWIRASVGQMIKLIPVDEVLYFRSDEKYTLVVWVGGEALIRKSIRELLDGLEPETFIQIHRSTIVNLRFVAQVIKGPNETAEVHLKGRNETLSVSRNHVHWFRQY